MSLGQMRGQHPTGTYARKVVEPLLIDLSWSSSRLEGNTYSLMETAELFKRCAAGDDLDAVMLLNHKSAIEFLVNAVPQRVLTSSLIKDLHAILMDFLLADPGNGLGRIRETVVGIGHSAYTPTQIPSLLDEMFQRVVTVASEVKNPVEAALFLWVNIAYLQPFLDGNKRTSRLAANIPLMGVQLRAAVISWRGCPRLRVRDDGGL